MPLALVQIPISFSYESTVYVSSSSSSFTALQESMILPAVNVNVTVTNRTTGNPATVYANSTGSSVLSPVQTDAGGNVPGWVVPGSYTITAAAAGGFGGASINWEAVRGDQVMQGSNNLSDVGSIASARTNLGLGNAATSTIDTVATDIKMNGTQAAGSIGKVADAGHIHPADTSRLAVANNLSELANPTTARSNLGAVSNTLSDLANVTTARSNLGFSSPARCYLGTVYTATTSTDGQIKFDTKSFDPGNALSGSPLTYHVPVTGYYLVTGQVSLATAANNWFEINVIINGTQQDIGTQIYTDGIAGRTYQIEVSDIMSVTAGQTITLGFGAGSYSSSSVQGGSGRTWMNVMRVA